MFQGLPDKNLEAVYGRKSVRLLLAVAVATWCGVTRGQDADRVDFNRDVKPILSDNCFHCHGPDKQRSRLRLDVSDVPLEKGAIIPGDAAASELVKRISSLDPEYHMPPPKANRHLSQGQIDTLRRWIEEGAVYERHWAFEPVGPVREISVNDDDGWMKTPVDSFVLQRLQDEFLKPRNEAERERLLRRVSFDLTGLPPTLEELDSFLSDSSGDAYGRVVDRLLLSPAYGERMAVDWLDVARYADTFGYQSDVANRVWPWRDWVIRAFNDNLPYDDFVRWQLAGDLLDDPTDDQLLATAFNRLHRQTNEGGSVNEEFLVEYAADRTETFSTAFLGMTMGCARCHEHKFDPISQVEYYELLSFFSNIDESGIYSHYTDATPTPAMFLYAGDQKQEHAGLLEKVKFAEARLDGLRDEATDRFGEWLSGFDGSIATPDSVVHLPLDELGEDGTINLANEEELGALSGGPDVVEGFVGGAFHFSGENSVSVKSRVDFERSDPFTIAFWMKLGDGMDKMVLAHHSKAASDAGSRGYEIYLDGGYLVAGLSHFWPGNSVRVQTVDQVPGDAWVHVAMAYDGSSRAEGVHLYVDGERVGVRVVRDNLYKTVRYGDANTSLMLAARSRDPGFKDGRIDEFKVFNASLTPAEIRGLVEPDADSWQESDLQEYYLARVDTKTVAARQQLWLARKVESTFINSIPEIMVMRENDRSASAHRLGRGEYTKPREEVFPGTPEAILAFPDDYPRNRLGLAEWLLRRDHPLTSRVAVNRIWKMFFGRGLVETVDNFGNQGSAPSHPELLDYLAGWFMDSDWDVKALCRLIVTSATYRQDSTPTSESVDRDPENLLMARGPRNRLSAEETRDAALFSSGLLVAKLGGPSVKPYQPEGLWKETSQISYAPDSGDNLYRRSMYTYFKRTVPPPMMMTFDATNREVCVAQRAVTTTPLQALVLLNDPQFVEAARALAERVLLEYEDDVGARLDAAFRTLTGRGAREREREILLEAYEEQKKFLGAEDAEAYTSVGELKAGDDVDRVDLSATTAVVQLIMNFEEFQVKL